MMAATKNGNGLKDKVIIAALGACITLSLWILDRTYDLSDDVSGLKSDVVWLKGFVIDGKRPGTH